MGRLSALLRRHAFQGLLLAVALIAFCKPILLATPDERPGRVMLELFVPWALVVLALFLVALSLRGEKEIDETGPERD
jgi:hypothetical protein